jgi:hypothetical protein
VSWKLHPRIRVSIDTRYESAFPPGLLEEHLAFYNAMGNWQSMLDRYPTDLVLSPAASPVVGKLARETRWTIVYEDEAWVLFAAAELALPHGQPMASRLTGSFP